MMLGNFFLGYFPLQIRVWNIWVQLMINISSFVGLILIYVYYFPGVWNTEVQYRIHKVSPEILVQRWRNLIRHIAKTRINLITVGIGGLGVTCSPRNPRFAGSNPAEVDGSFSGSKNPEHKSSGRDFKLGVSSLRFLTR